MNQPVLALTSFAALLAALPARLSAQLPGMPAPPPGIPLVQPSVPHPALAAQPLLQPDSGSAAAVPGGSRTGPAGPAGPGIADAPDPAELRAQEFLKTRIEGRDLSKAVGRVLKDLDWHESLKAAKADARAHDRPILWVQSLGELDGFA